MEAADVRQYAEYLLRADRIEAALTALRAAVVDDPAALALLREAYARRTQPEALVAELRKLVKAHPDRRHLLMALADTLREQDRPDEALELLRARAAGASANAALRWAVFDALAEQGDVAAALAEATAAVRAQPRAASDAAIRINELAAQADALAAPKLGDDFAAAFVSALYAEARGELDAALGDFARAVALAPDFLPARVRLARMHWRVTRGMTRSQPPVRRIAPRSRIPGWRPSWEKPIAGSTSPTPRSSTCARRCD
jgi:tetratricopeptide (TPR) repeat protein